MTSSYSIVFWLPLYATQSLNKLLVKTLLLLKNAFHCSMVIYGHNQCKSSPLLILLNYLRKLGNEFVNCNGSERYIVKKLRAFS